MNRRLTLDGSPFAGRTGRGVRVAIVDSGIAAGHPHIGPVAGGVSLIQAADNPLDYRDRLGHGTAVAAAIREKAPDAELLAVRLFDLELRATADILAQAICWAADNAAHLINLSLGTPNAERRDLLTEAVAYAAARGATVVAALEQHGAQMYPGALDGVVGVLRCSDCARDELFVVNAALPALRVYASGYPRPIPGVPPELNFSGASFAVANATGFLARLLEDQPASVGKLKDLLMIEGLGIGG